jgi:uncharacterized membrane-anchored protein YhcB (DUF1043 family)
MLESLATSPVLWVVVTAALAAGLGFAIGRSGGAAARRVRALQVSLAEERAVHDKARSEYDGYRKRVADHFSETSERLHDLTLQYRAVYEHLAQGATELCPEGFSKLEGGLGLDALPEEVAQRPASEGIAQRPASNADVDHEVAPGASPPEPPRPH